MRTGREAGAWASTLVGGEASFYAVVIQPRASATRHDVVDVVAPQVNDVGGRICAQSAIDPVEHQLAGLVVSDTH